MYPILHELLRDQKGGEVFTCFGPWHWCYLLAFFTVGVLALVRLRSEGRGVARRGATRWINCAFGLYILDFFLMPLAYGMIDIEKLPFHVCTAMCVMCFLSTHIPWLEPWRLHFVLLGFLSNLVYLIYPAGVMWYGVHPASYRVIQTLTFHGTMTVYGFLTLMLEWRSLNWQFWRRDLAVIAAMTGWAMLGNLIYNGEVGTYRHFFNWFFVVRDPFYILPEKIAPWVMPVVNIVVFFGAEMLVYSIISVASRRRKETE